MLKNEPNAKIKTREIVDSPSWAEVSPASWASIAVAVVVPREQQRDSNPCLQRENTDKTGLVMWYILTFKWMEQASPLW